MNEENDLSPSTKNIMKTWAKLWNLETGVSNLR